MSQAVDSHSGNGEAASRLQLARRLHQILAVGTPLLAIAAFRSGLQLEHPGMLLLCAVWFPVFLWGGFSRAQGVRLLAVLVILPVYMVSLDGLIEVGRSPGSAAALVLPIVLAGLFFGRRAAWAATLLVMATILAVGEAFHAGWLTVPAATLSDPFAHGVWLRMAVGLATVGLLLVTSITTLLRRYELSLEDTRRALRELGVEQERRQREALDAVHSRDDFLVIAGHELRTPLTPLLLEVQALERRAPDGDPNCHGAVLAARLHKTVAHVQRLSRLVDELLDVSQILAGKLKVCLEPVDLVTITRGVAERFSELLASSGSALTVRAPEECVGMWDRSRLDQVMTNLLSNAIKYGSGKPIELALESTCETVILTVRDHGIGIEERARARIFGRFERAVPAEHFGGFGVGLWVVKQILEALDGNVIVDSVPGVGTTFYVMLPRGAVHLHELAPRDRAQSVAHAQ